MSEQGRPAPSMRTPCIKVCIVDGESGLCMGCYRRLNEVAGWSKMTPEARDAVMAELPSRRSLIRPEKLAMFS
jgi:predicted Fe-S protein YdhL (DUF1289 family)